MHYFQGLDSGIGFGPAMAVFGGLFFVALVWSLFWKGLALWHSARRGEQWWFLAMLVINTMGILEIVYLFGFAKLKFNQLFSGIFPDAKEDNKPHTPQQ